PRSISPRPTLFPNVAFSPVPWILHRHAMPGSLYLNAFHAMAGGKIMRNHNRNTTTEDLKTIAQDMLRMGKHWAQSAQGWLDQRRWDMQDGDGFRSHGTSAADAGSEPVRGGYRGVGPRDYVRADERIVEEINEQLTDADDLDASSITLKVENGIATLAGSVPQRRMKHRAEDIAVACNGVRDVRNEIQVNTL